MTYQFPKSVRTPRSTNRLKPKKEASEKKLVLAGAVSGKKASREEEQITRSLNKDSAISGFIFRYKVPTSISLPGKDREVDWIVFSRGRFFPLDFNGRVGHGLNITQTAKDQNREQQLNLTFKEVGFEPLQTIWWWQNEDNDQGVFDKLVRDLF